MRRFILSVSLLCAAGVFASGAFAQSYGGYRDNPYYRGGGDNGYNRDYRPGGYGGGGIVDRAMADVQQAASGYYARRQHRHVDHALNELSKFENKMRRGKFDRHALDEAIGELSHLANSGDLDPRARDILARDADELREFRARGQYDYYRR